MSRPTPFPARIARSLAVLAVGCALFSAPSLAEETDEAAATDDECLECHEEMDGEEITFEDGSTLAVELDLDAMKASVHHGRVGCTECHTAIEEYPHPAITARDARSYRRERAKGCNVCHYAYYTRVLDSIHYAELEQGNKDVPTCVDCHGAHGITEPNQPRISVDRKCAACHAQISKAYEGSVHGRALLEQSAAAADAPVCTDCHGAHAIRDPKQPEFHASAHELCARCHGDADKMARYGLNPNVATTYLDDFHGVSNQLYAAGLGSPDRPMATCVDCHGVHDIQRFDDSGGAAAVRTRVATMCRRCHAQVPDAFADAWLSHYEPTLASAPLVWGVKWVYRILIPLIMVGLVLHILLHLWQVRTHRIAGAHHASPQDHQSA